MARTRIHLTPAEAAAKGLLCRSSLKADRLMPGPHTEPAGSVWQGQGAYQVYDPAECVPWRWQPGPAQLRRQAVAAQALQLLEADCAVLDVESTGLGAGDEICEITVLDASGRVLLDTLVRPSRPIPAEASAIHGITDDMVASAPTWEEVAARYAAAVADRTVVTYNVAFDKRLIEQTHALHGLRAPQLSTACAMLLYASWHGEWDRERQSWRWLKLKDAAKACGVDQPGAHRSLVDAQMALGILLHLRRFTSGRRPRRHKSTGN